MAAMMARARLARSLGWRKGRKDNGNFYSLSLRLSRRRRRRRRRDVQLSAALILSYLPFRNFSFVSPTRANFCQGSQTWRTSSVRVRSRRKRNGNFLAPAICNRNRICLTPRSCTFWLAALTSRFHPRRGLLTLRQAIGSTCTPSYISFKYCTGGSHVQILLWTPLQAKKAPVSEIFHRNCRLFPYK